jgi:hypothetical protein
MCDAVYASRMYIATERDGICQSCGREGKNRSTCWLERGRVCYARLVDGGPIGDLDAERATRHWHFAYPIDIFGPRTTPSVPDKGL